MTREMVFPLLIIAGSSISLYMGIRDKRQRRFNQYTGRWREPRFETKNVVVGVVGLVIGLIYLVSLLVNSLK